MTPILIADDSKENPHIGDIQPDSTDQDYPASQVCFGRTTANDRDDHARNYRGLMRVRVFTLICCRRSFLIIPLLINDFSFIRGVP